MIHELFEKQVQQSPDAIAVVFEEEQLTYRELNRRAGNVALQLQALGVGTDVLVALYLERSLEMIVGMLGVLKAGGAYVPLDPGHPRSRIASVLEDAQPLVLLTQERLKANLPSHGARVVAIDSRMPADLRETPPSREPSLNDLAYVIYTSGSTGKPKGVEIEHRAVVNFLASMRRQPGLSAEDTMLAITTLAFDIAVLEIFLPLICGASVVVASARSAHDGTALVDLINRRSVSAIQATPSTFRMLVDAGWIGSPGLKILCGGEAWNAELANLLLTRCDSLWNMYGPTETTIWSAVAKVEAGRPIAIGTPIANTRLYVLDRARQLLPVGVSGELYIGGTGLARGYVRQPELTRERFVPDPYAIEPGARMYRTGDLVRRLADGTLEFLGRLDHQVKVHGHRVELGEIEAALESHSEVKQCAVVAFQDPQGEYRLVAYVIPTSDTDVAADELRLFLSQALPSYMIPSAFVSLSSFPLTPNGKLDRKALPFPDRASREKTVSLAPRNAAEEAMARLWCEMLKLAEVGVRDNFFDLGGNSVLAARIIGRINQTLITKVGVNTIFRAPTIEALTATIDREQRADRDGTNIIAFQTGHKGLPLYFIGAGPVENRIAQLIGGDRAIFAVDMPIPAEWRQAITTMDRSSLPTFGQLGDLYADALLKHVGSSPCIVVGYSFSGKVAFEATRAMQRAMGNVAFVLLVDAYSWSGLTRGTVRQVLSLIWSNALDESAKNRSHTKRLSAAVGALRLLWWLLVQAPRVVNARVRKNRRPTSMVDSEGMPIDQSVINRLSRVIGRYYNPQPLDASGVLIRAKLPHEEILPQVDLTNGWRGLFTRGLEVVQLTGNHWSIVSNEQSAIELGKQINAVLDRFDLSNKKQNRPEAARNSGVTAFRPIAV
jgi:amino acid adenylation domain-containing protein